jgi:hypothetical protein
VRLKELKIKGKASATTRMRATTTSGVNKAKTAR